MNYSPLVIPLYPLPWPPYTVAIYTMTIWKSTAPALISFLELTLASVSYTSLPGASHRHLKLSMYKNDLIFFLSNLPLLLYILIVTLQLSIACARTQTLPLPASSLNLSHSCHGLCPPNVSQINYFHFQTLSLFLPPWVTFSFCCLDCSPYFSWDSLFLLSDANWNISSFWVLSLQAFGVELTSLALLGLHLANCRS